jgi:hypothetical protein
VKFFLVFIVAFCLGACTTGTSAVVETVKLIGRRDTQAAQPPSAPGLRYLRVDTHDGTVFMVLGYVEHAADGDTNVWYSNKGEVVKLRRGRIVATAGLATDWRDVRFSSLPDWHQAAGQTLRYRRSRDEMPGYRFGIDETLILHAIEAPQDVAFAAPAGAALRWFEERVDGLLPDALPPSLYAVDLNTGRTLYGRQCLAANLCLAWQAWSEGMR